MKNIGYKVTDSNMQCRGYQYELGKTYTHNGEIKMCGSGFHFCLRAQDCFNYYSFDSQNRVFEIEYSGTVEHGEDKSVTDSITFIRELDWQEVLELVNSGKHNTGLRNSGNWNSGDSNSGDSNSGNWNSGDRNSGDSNSGDRNSGDSNSGYRNSGNSNSGDRNSGDRNSGNWNSGDRNSGDSNSGYRNSGDRNSGNWNSGNWNSGNWNSGDRNSGDSNSGYRNSGAFCTEINPVLWLFDQPTDMTVREWERSDCYKAMLDLESHMWVDLSLMSDDEKNKHPQAKTTGGYLKSKTHEEMWADFWGNASQERKNLFLNLPNFDADKFKEITGIDVTKN